MDPNPVLVVENRDIAVYYREWPGGSALAIFSREGLHDLPASLGAVNQASLMSPYPARQVRYRPAQPAQPGQPGLEECIILNYGRSLTDDESLTFAQVFVRVVGLRG